MDKRTAMIAALAVLGGCHSQETRERIRNGDLERTAEEPNGAQPAPASNPVAPQPQ